MNTQVYILRCLSNLHAGAGDSNMGVIDKEVQRDPVDKYPTIHSSSLKGALREYFENHVKASKTNITQIFGSEAGDETNKSSGKLFFGRGMLLSLPVRSDKFPYFNVTTPDILKAFVEQMKLNGVKGQENLIANIGKLTAISDEELKDGPLVFRGEHDQSVLEEENYTAKTYVFPEPIADQKAWRESLETILGGPFALMAHSQFCNLAKDLPVIARNHLEDGQSKNLWYEEIVPREARFATFIQGEELHLKMFSDHTNGKIIQVGANATVGYGQTLFTLLNA
ncbi:MAG: type III-B CRISPR module RAMP protein Cmr4 [Bacteroidia bacterium]|nr:type III-B CRISPR module RAMP protein Cmr4 [Bacteroidia bacterium]